MFDVYINYLHFNTKMILVGDVGGSNFRLALIEDGKMTKQNTFSTQIDTDFAATISQFIGNQFVSKGCIAIAGPVEGDAGDQTVTITNQ